MPSAFQQAALEYRANLDTSNFERGTDRMVHAQNRADKAFNRGNKGLRRQTHLYSQIARGADDAAYGIRGMQNNLIEIAISSGAGGPVILAITGLLITLQVLERRWLKAQKAAKEYQKELSKGQGAIATTRLYAEVLKTSEKGTDAYTIALEELKKKGFDPASGSLEKFLKLQEKQILLNALEKASSSEIADSLADIIKARRKLAEAEKSLANLPETSVYDKARGIQTGTPADFGRAGLEATIIAQENAIKKSQDRIVEITKIGAEAIKDLVGDGGLAEFIIKGDKKSSNIEGFVAQSLEDLVSAFGAGLKGEYGDKLADAFSFSSVNINEAAFDETGQAIAENLLESIENELLDADLDSLLSSLDSKLAGLSDKAAMKWVALGDTIGITSEDIARSTVSAFESAATQTGNFFGNLATGISSALGSVLIQEGTANIIAGIGRNALIPGSGTKNITIGSAEVVAGVALKSGANIAGKQNSISGGGGASAASSSATPVADPRYIQGSENKGRNVGGLSTRDGDIIISSDVIRQSMQAADRKYPSLGG